MHLIIIPSAVVVSVFHVLLLLRADTVASIGINYGQIGNNLPSPEDVVPLVKSIGGTKVRLYDANENVLRAFANTGVEFTVGLGNEYLARMCDPDTAEQWIKANVQSHLPATNITCIAVGNEVLTFNDQTLSDNLLPAMEGLHTALVTLGLHKQVTVTTAHSLAILQTSYPPSAGSFRHDLSTYVPDILSFHARTNSPFLINAYPFFAYKANPKQVSLDYVLFQSTTGVVDPGTGLRYDNMLFAQIDSVYAALASMGYKNLSVHISETGWPSRGDPDEFGATPENARRYNGNLMKVVAQKTGTPMNPENDLNIYLFALFNENMKQGPTSERNYGLFKPDRTPVYALPITKNDGVSYNASVGGDVDSSAPTSSPPPPETTSSSTAYLSFSSSSHLVPYGICTLFLPCVASMNLLFFH